MGRPSKTTLRERQDELRLRLQREKAGRKSWEWRLQHGKATDEDLLRAMAEGRFRSRADAKRAWGLL